MIYKRNIVPSLFTMLNLFFGYFAIVHAMQGKFVTASWLIILAAVWDALDGRIARLTQTFSEFGVQFDSIADVVSFGAAPSVLVFKVFFYKMGAIGVILSFFPLLFGAIRLARFNVNLGGFEKENFSGLPIPAMATALSAYVIFNYDLWEGLKFGPVLIPIVLVLSVLMVSNIEYEVLPKFSFRGSKKNSIVLGLLLSGVLLVVFFREKALFPLIMIFILFYAIRGLVYWNRENEEDEDVLDVSLPE